MALAKQLLGFVRTHKLSKTTAAKIVAIMTSLLPNCILYRQRSGSVHFVSIGNNVDYALLNRLSF